MRALHVLILHGGLGGAHLDYLSQLLAREVHQHVHLLRAAPEVLDAECVHADTHDPQLQAPVQRVHQLAAQKTKRA
jgi:hypothetical protein